MLSWIAAVSYIVVSALCVVASQPMRAGDSGRPIGAVWWGIASLFALLAASRVFAVEDQVRELLRTWFYAEGEYQARRAIQGPIAATVLGVGGLAGIYLLLQPRGLVRGPAPRALAWASRAAAAMIGLVALRLVSFHATDALLYAPLGLNWVLDIGLTLIVAGSAWAFIRAAGYRDPRSAR